jgi:cytochrome d ubiquinol oxidase subunit I
MRRAPRLPGAEVIGWRQLMPGVFDPDMTHKAALLRRERSVAEAKIMIGMALDLLIIIVPLQFILGDLHGLNTREYQPAKLAAIEGRYDTAAPAPLTLFGIPDDASATMNFAVDVPYLGSLVLTHSWNGKIEGLKDFAPDQRPPVAPPFFGFRIMVGIGGTMLAIVAVGQIMRRNERRYRLRWFLLLCQAAAPLGFIAVIAGWVTTEVGRHLPSWISGRACEPRALRIFTPAEPCSQVGDFSDAELVTPYG